MKLRSKAARTEFRVILPEKDNREVVIEQAQWLSSKQRSLVGRYYDMTLQFAHFLRDEYKGRGYQQVEVYVTSKVSLNSRDFQLIFDPDTDLVKIPRTLGHNDWILPLEMPFKRSDEDD